MKKNYGYPIKKILIAGMIVMTLALTGCDIFAQKARVSRSSKSMPEQLYPEVEMRLKPGQLEMHPSFEACSYYFNPGNSTAKKYVVEFRKSSDRKWQRAFYPMCDQPSGIWKGSIFQLTENSTWQLRVLLSGKMIAQGKFKTWDSHPPIAKVIDISKLGNKNNKGIMITENGKADGWIKYTAPPGWILKLEYDQEDPQPAAVNFNHASHVILENITIIGGYRYAIHVNQSEAIRIINCDISGWGRLGKQQFESRDGLGQYIDHKGNVINYDAGISIYKSAQTVVERCYIHDPRNRANAWMFSHPAAPCFAGMI
jgi:Right handed beta helix region